MADMIREMRNWTTVPIIAQPDADSPLVKGGVTVCESLLMNSPKISWVSLKQVLMLLVVVAGPLFS